MRTQLPFGFVLGFVLASQVVIPVSSQTTSNTDALLQRLEDVSKTLLEIENSKMPIDLSGTYKFTVNHNLESDSLVKVGTFSSSENVTLGSLTNVAVRRTGTNVVEMTFHHPTPGSSLEEMTASLEKKGLRPAEPTELAAFSRYYTNRIGQFWIEIPVGDSVERPFRHNPALSLFNENRTRTLSYSSFMMRLGAPYFWIAYVKK